VVVIWICERPVLGFWTTS